MNRSELERQLTELGASVADRLAEDQRAWLAEFIDAGEYGIALEMIADWLSEADAPLSHAERTEAQRLSESMGNVDRVMGPLGHCPDQRSDSA